MTDLLKCEIDHLQQANRTLLEAQDRLTSLMGADIVRLEGRAEKLAVTLEMARPYVAHCAEGEDNEIAASVLVLIDVLLEDRT